MAESEHDARQRYERAEAEFLLAVRANQDRLALTALAGEASERANRWNAAAHRELITAYSNERVELTYMTERTEVLAALWGDIVRAFQDLPALRDG